MDTLSLFLNLFERLRENDETEAAYLLRNLADDIETQGCPPLEDLEEIMHSVVSEYEDVI